MSGEANAISASTPTSSSSQTPVISFKSFPTMLIKILSGLDLRVSFTIPGMFRLVDLLPKIAGGVIKHLSKLCTKRVGRHAVGVRFAQEPSNPNHFVCRVSITFPQFSTVADGDGDAPCHQDLCDEVDGRKPYVVLLGGALDFMPNLLRPVIVCPSLDGGRDRPNSEKIFRIPSIQL
jgi:hypothetical protein